MGVKLKFSDNESFGCALSRVTVYPSFRKIIAAVTSGKVIRIVLDVAHYVKLAAVKQADQILFS